MKNARRGSAKRDRPWQEPPDPAPLDPLNQPPVDRYCDLVLTGGVADGVIYPWAILELARAYRFKNIGGTSVGAMAAALTAAAEYARRHGSVTGFNEVLRKLPRKLAEDVDGKGMTRLFSLFQPATSTRRLFELFVDLAEMNSGASGKDRLRDFLRSRPARGGQSPIRRRQRTFKSRMRRLLVWILRSRRKCKICGMLLSFAAFGLGAWQVAKVVLVAYREAAFIGILIAVNAGLTAKLLWTLGLLPTLPATLMWSALPWTPAIVAVCIAIAMLVDIFGGFLNNNFGICMGYSAQSAAPGRPSLIEWLHEGIQGACGKPLDRPLTFRDLWDAPGGPAGSQAQPTQQSMKSRSIDLRMVTTSLTHGRPFPLPIEDETSRLFYKRKDLEPYFPKVILDFLDDRSSKYVPKTNHADPDREKVPVNLRELPAGDLPVLVATRLSLSFPVLFSAVPLWAIDYEAKHKKRTLRKCWFSDGGICSNFPVHLFDAALPRWPTFGITLVPRSLYWKDEPTFLPTYHYQGRGDRWDRFGDKTLPVTGQRNSPAQQVAGFLASIFLSAKDWKDKTSMRMPAVRDRVIRVSLLPGEAGLNLRIKRHRILDFANDYGLRAGRELVQKFAGRASHDGHSQFWNEHRWVRFNSLLAGLRERLEGIGAAAERADYAQPLSAQIEQAAKTPPLSAEHPDEGAQLTPDQAQDLQYLLATLIDLEARFAKAKLPQPYTPLPTPIMRIRPPL